MKMYKIYIKDEAEKTFIPLKTREKPELSFDCYLAAEKYAERIGLKSGFEIR